MRVAPPQSEGLARGKCRGPRRCICVAFAFRAFVFGLLLYAASSSVALLAADTSPRVVVERAAAARH